MSRFVNISELADQVLESVRTETRAKTASAQAPVRTYVPVARELRKLAADLREAGPADEVGEADMAALMQDPEVMQLLQELEANPELLQHLLEQGAGGPEGQELAAGAAGGPDGDMPSPEMMPSGAHPGMDAEAASGMPPGAMGAPPPASHQEHEDKPPHHGQPEKDDRGTPPGLKAASEIRKIAAQLKTLNEHSKKVRLVKAAQMLNAATGLKHLTEGFK